MTSGNVRLRPSISLGAASAPVTQTRDNSEVVPSQRMILVPMPDRIRYCWRTAKPCGAYGNTSADATNERMRVKWRPRRDWKTFTRWSGRRLGRRKQSVGVALWGVVVNVEPNLDFSARQRKHDLRRKRRPVVHRVHKQAAEDVDLPHGCN